MQPAVRVLPIQGWTSTRQKADVYIWTGYGYIYGDQRNPKLKLSDKVLLRAHYGFVV